MPEKKFDKGKALTVGVIALLILIFVGLFWYGLNKVLAMEGSFPPNVLEEGVVAAPETADDAVKVITTAYKDAESLKPRVRRSDSFSVENYEIESSDATRAAFDYVMDEFEGKLEEGFEGFETDFGEAFPDKMMAPDLSAADLISYVYYVCENCGRESENPEENCGECGNEKPYVKKADAVHCDYIYYQCPSCDETSKVYLDSCELCGSVYPYEKRYKDEYEMKAEIVPGSLDKLFAPLTKSEAKALLGDELQGVVDLKDFKVNYDRIQIFAKVNRLTGKITYLEYIKQMTVEADVDFTGDYDSVTGGDVTLKLTEKNKFDFVWPGLSLNNHEMIIEPGSTDNLLATLSCTDPTKPVVTWTASDESIFTVDDEGYIKAGKKPGTGTVKASFEFNGETYTDECTVIVRVPVESVKLNKRKADIKVGEEISFTPKFSPDNATVQTVKWYTEDEKIASIDENTGVVTGVSAGTVIIYSLSDDGYFKSSCEVTVE